MKKKLTVIITSVLIAASSIPSLAGEIKLYYSNDNLIPIKYDSNTGEIMSNIENSYQRDNPVAKNQATYDITVPEVIDGQQIKSVPYLGFYDDDRIKSIILPSTLTEIGKKAFYGADSLESIDLSHVEKIGDASFYSCDSLKSVILGNDIEVISSQAFMNCKNLEDITLGRKISTICSQAFSGCRSLKSVEFPSSLRVVDDSSFKDCTSLESITLPNGTVKIEANAFSGCKNLESIYLPKTVTSIGKNAFKDCTSLKKAVIPSNCKSIDISVFDGCGNITIVCEKGSRASVIASIKGFATQEYVEEEETTDVTSALIDITDNTTQNVTKTDIDKIDETEKIDDDKAETDVYTTKYYDITETEEQTEQTTEFIETTTKQKINLFVNDTEVDCGISLPVIKNNRTLVPMRPLFEALDVSVNWVDTTKSVICKKDDTVITVTIGSYDAMINGRYVHTQIAPEIIDGYTYVPVRFLSENLGMNVSWDDETKSVSISAE